MANVINATSTGNGGLVSTGDDSGILNIQTNETTAITVDASQNVTVNSSTAQLSFTGNGTTSGLIVAPNVSSRPSTSNPLVQITSGNGSGIYGYAGNIVISGRPTDNSPNFGNIYFQTGSTQQNSVSIDAGGSLLVGTTTATYSAKLVASATGVSTAVLITDTSAEYGAVIVNKATSGNNGFLLFQTETSPVTRGSITYNRAGGLVVYNTTSDYRAKTVNGLVQNALSKVALLKPSTGRMNGATEDIDFFVAHELKEVVPSAVTGEKDAVNEDSTPKYQMVDKSALIPLLTAALQETKALIDTQAETINALTARIVALETA